MFIMEDCFHLSKVGYHEGCGIGCLSNRRGGGDSVLSRNGQGPVCNRDIRHGQSIRTIDFSYTDAAGLRESTCLRNVWSFPASASTMAMPSGTSFPASIPRWQVEPVDVVSILPEQSSS